MKSPATIEGSALIASTSIRTGRAIVPPTSLRNTAVANASGTEMSVAMPTCSSVPMMACEAPPWDKESSGPTCDWSSVRKCRWSEWYPFATTPTMIATRGMSTTIVELTISVRARWSFAVSASLRFQAISALITTNVAHQMIRKPSPPESGVIRS